jgi:hypothetical protein
VNRALPVVRFGAGDRSKGAGSLALRLDCEEQALGAKQRVDPEAALRRLDCLVGAD